MEGARGREPAMCLRPPMAPFFRGWTTLVAAWRLVPPIPPHLGGGETASQGLGTHPQGSEGRRRPCWSPGRGADPSSQTLSGQGLLAATSIPAVSPGLGDPSHSRTFLQAPWPQAHSAIWDPWTKARGQKTSVSSCGPHSACGLLRCVRAERTPPHRQEGELWPYVAASG